jgi:hypothetical protein
MYLPNFAQPLVFVQSMTLLRNVWFILITISHGFGGNSVEFDVILINTKGCLC